MIEGVRSACVWYVERPHELWWKENEYKRSIILKNIHFGEELREVLVRC